MELFKNSVGRPSNDILIKRRKFVILIIVAVIAVLGVSTFLVVRSFSGGSVNGKSKNATGTTKTFTARFERNGAQSISYSSVSCSTTKSSCVVKLATIKPKTGFKNVGWGHSSDTTLAILSSGRKLGLTGNVKYYAITKSTSPYKASFKKTSNVSSIGKSSVSCYRYNGASTCKVTAPSIKAKSGYKVLGWSTYANATSAQYSVGSSISLN